MDKLILYDKKLGEILGIPDEGYKDYTKLKWQSLDDNLTSLAITKKFVVKDLEGEPRILYKSEMKPSHKVFFEFVNNVVLPK